MSERGIALRDNEGHLPRPSIAERVREFFTESDVMRIEVSEEAGFTIVGSVAVVCVAVLLYAITLLRAMHVGWQDCETGAPEIDPKRPYGNSSVAYDVADELGIPVEWEDENNDEMSEAQFDQMMALHRQTAVALQIVLVTGSFTPGTYECEPYTRKWKMVSA